MKLTLFLLFIFFGSINANGLGFLGCCGGPGPGPYPAGTMTPSGYPIYGMAPHASDAVAYSSPGSSYGYGSSGGYGGYGGGSGYGSSGGYGSSAGYGSSGYGSYGSSGGSGYYGGSDTSGMGSSGIDFDSIPYGNPPLGSQPIAIRYFKEAIPVDIDPARLRPLGQTQLMRMPIYGISRSHQTEYQPSSYHSSSMNYQSTPNLYRPGMGGGEGFTSKYNKFAHAVESDISRGYQPAYSNWNRQPMQAVFRQGEAPPSMGGTAGGSSSSGYSGSSSGYSGSSSGHYGPSGGFSGSSGSEHIAPVRPAPVEESSGFSESGSSGSSGSDFRGSSGSSGRGESSGLEISRSSHGSESASPSIASESSVSSSGSSTSGNSFPDVRSEARATGLSKTGFPDLPSVGSSSSKSEQPFPDIASPKAGSTSGSISNSGNAFPDIRTAEKASKAGSFQTAEASLPNHFRARAAAATSSATSEHASELKPVSLQNLPRRSTGAENYKLSGEVLDTVNALLREREKAAH